MKTIEEVQIICRSIDTKGKVNIICVELDKSINIKLCLIDNSLCQDFRPLKENLHKITDLKAVLDKSVRTLTEWCYRNGDCL